MKIINLTQHQATEEQKTQGVFDLEDTRELKALLTFNDIPDDTEMRERASRIAEIAKSHFDENGGRAMIGGAPFFMSVLENALLDADIYPLYAFSKREVVETTKEDGTVVKTAVFKHVGFVECVV